MKSSDHFTAHLEAFSEPRTIPGGWDLTGMLAPRPSSEGAGHAPDPQPRAPAEPQTPASPESFEHIHGYPRHWNLTCLV